MFPRPLVPHSLVPFLDSTAWFVAFAGLCVLLVLARWFLAEYRPVRWALAVLTLGAFGMFALLEMQRRVWIDPVVLSWSGFLLWACFSFLIARLFLGILFGRMVRERLAKNFYNRFWKREERESSNEH